MMNLSKFQLILLAIFAGLSVAGVITFATYRSGGKGGAPVTLNNITFWGTFDQKVMEDVISRLKKDLGQGAFKVSYVKKRKETIERELLEALATGQGPDLFLLPQDEIIKYQDKIFKIPFESYPERSFKDTFIEESEIYMMSDGILAFPFIVDPLVMYWNRTLFTNAGIAMPPKTWADFLSLAPFLTKRDQANNIVKSAIAFGEIRNVVNAKEILSALIIQAGTPIVMRGADGGRQAVLNERFGFTAVPAEAAVRFYIDFSNPVKPLYSWNKAMPLSRDAFIAEDLAVYFGFASELAELRLRNPNLNFDVAPLPQTQGTDIKATFGKMYGVAIMKNSRFVGDAFRAAAIFSGANAQAYLVEGAKLPPVRRDMLAERPSDAFHSIFYDSALISRAWLDPDPEKTAEIFRDMIESSISGRARVSEAVGRANAELGELLRTQ
jgi:ABC-type glycerol-3-phosphate transport system substrate-binding protein